MLIFFSTIHVVLCVFLIFVILLQPGKDAGMGAALGGGAATSAFGGRGAVTFLSKMTAVCAGLFFLTSLGLSFVGLKGSIVAGDDAPSTPSAATPAAATANPDRAVAPKPAEGDPSPPAATVPAAPTPATAPLPAEAAESR